MIFWFVLFAWSGLASAFTPVVLCSLFWRRTTRAGAIAGMVAGFVSAIAWALVFKERFLDLYEMIPGFAAGFAVTIAVSLLTEPPPGAGEEIDDVRRVVGGTLYRRRRIMSARARGMTARPLPGSGGERRSRTGDWLRAAWGTRKRTGGRRARHRRGHGARPHRPRRDDPHHGRRQPPGRVPGGQGRPLRGGGLPGPPTWRTSGGRRPR